MNIALTFEQQAWHQSAINLCKQHRLLEWQIVEVLQQIDRAKVYQKLGVTSLFQYAVQILGLSESVAYGFISVSRKASSIPILRASLQQQKISVAKASRIVSALDNTNASQLISYAQTHSSREIDFEIAQRNPKGTGKQSIRPIAEDVVELKFSISKITYQKLTRAQAVLAQKSGENPNLAATLDLILNEYLQRQDPVKKAARAIQKNPKLCAHKVPEMEIKTRQPTFSRTRLKAAEKHLVFARDGGRCTHQDASGRRCDNDRWVQIHHIQPVRAGGSNDPSNLTTLCSVHHDLVHQLSLPLDGQVTWLREPRISYG